MGGQLPHLFITQGSQSFPYTYPGSGGSGGSRLPTRDPIAHGAKLRGDLKSVQLVQDTIEKERARLQIEAEASQINFDIDPNKGFKPESLENATAGIALSLLHTREDGAGHAIVRVPKGEVTTFIRKLEQYEDPNQQTQSGKPKHQPLFACVSGIRPPTIRDFWTGPDDEFPTEEKVYHWEVWVRRDVGATHLRNQANRLGLTIGQQTLTFPDREVVLARATIQAMTNLLRLVDSITELRPPNLARPFLEMKPKEQSDWIADLLSRAQPVPTRARVCLLDTGLDYGHPLLAPAIDEEAVLAYNSSWGKQDHGGHGTLMAGLIVYGEHLATHLESNDSVPIEITLESVKILPPPPAENEPALYGEITKSCVALVEAHNAEQRVFCLAVTANPSPTGEPSSWSAAIDQICSGAEEPDDASRLVLISAGNSDWNHGNYGYPEWNHELSPIQEPAQAWNAVTVGSCTHFYGIFDDYPSYVSVASRGDLSPFSSTSVPACDGVWASQPDIVFEGGNLLLHPEGLREVPPEFALLSTRRRLGGFAGAALLDIIYETSASTAVASHFAAKLMTEYPDARPETIRGLMIHSARWTDPMLESFPEDTGRTRVRKRQACFGMGAPDLERARYSQRNALTLVVEREIQPFTNDGKTNELHLHDIPWPTQVLESLEATPVELRVTLSYFIEPNPGSRGWKGRYRYASHGLRFEVCTASDDEASFSKRINKAAREEGEKAGSSSDVGEWTIGPDARHRGSVHSDIWKGTARDLAAKHLVAVYPAKGWWSERAALGRQESKAWYSLIISLETPPVVGTAEIDIYSAVAELATEIEVEWAEE